MSTEETQDPNSELYCPHFQDIDEKTLRQLFSKVAAIRADNRELFNFTHRPIEVFQSPQGTQAEEKIVGEDRVYQEFSENRIGNFSVVIEGEVGTGKSELCAYLAHKLEEDGRPILHVDKNDDLMTLLSERIPEFYKEQFGEELPGASNFTQLKHDLEKNPSVVANNATSGALLNLSAGQYEINVQGKDDKIREFIQDQLSLLVEKGEYAKEIKFVSEQAYRRNDFLQVIEGDINDTEAVEAFNNELWREIRDRYQTASLDDVLQQVGKKFTDTRPVIIFEDFAITAMEGQRLRNYMERDKPADNWDFVVAGTRDSTQVLHKLTAEDRFEFYRTNKQNSNSVLFLDEDSAVDFIRPYLGYFKSFDGSVAYDRSGDGLDLELEPAPTGSICHTCGFCDESFRDLFPFNQPFLKRIYSGLREDEQSPREYVMAVFDILRDYYDGYITVPSDSDRLSTITSPIDAATEVYEHEESLAKLARWYGTPTQDGIEVDKRFVEVFGLSDAADSITGIESTDGSLVIPTDSGSTPPKGSQSETGSKSGKETSGEKAPEPPQTRSKIERLLDEHRTNVQPWQQNPGNFPEINRYLRAGLSDAIERLTNGYEVYEGMSLRYNLSSQTDPFVFESSQQAPDDDQISIDPEEFRLSDLKKLLEFGIYRVEDKPGADYEKLFRSVGTQLTGYAQRWQENIKDHNIRSEMCLFKQSSIDYELEDFVLAGYARIVLLDTPFVEVTAENLSKRFSEGSSYSLDSELRSELESELSKDNFNDILKFVEDGDWYEKMVGAMFGANANTLDIAKMRKRLEKKPPYKVLSGLGRQYIGRISHRLRFDTNNKFRDIANKAYDVHRALKDIEGEFRSDVIDVFSEELSEVSLSDVKLAVETLRTYDDADADMIESLSKFVSLNQSDIDAAVDAAEFASKSNVGRHNERLQAILISMKLGGTDVYQRYDDITIVSGGSTSTFAEDFLTVGAHYVD